MSCGKAPPRRRRRPAAAARTTWPPWPRTRRRCGACARPWSRRRRRRGRVAAEAAAALVVLLQHHPAAPASRPSRWEQVSRYRGPLAQGRAGRAGACEAAGDGWRTTRPASPSMNRQPRQLRAAVRGAPAPAMSSAAPCPKGVFPKKGAQPVLCAHLRSPSKALSSSNLPHCWQKRLTRRPRAAAPRAGGARRCSSACEGALGGAQGGTARHREPASRQCLLGCIRSTACAQCTLI